MPRLSVFPVFLSCMLLATAVSAQETTSREGETVHAVVQGLAATDLLNIRQDPSPLGRTAARLPNGTLVARRDCRLVDGYEWCHVTATDPEDQTELSGWAPGRYLELLQPLDAASLDVADDPEDAAGRASRLPQDEDAPLPPGLEARFSGGDALPVEDVRNGGAAQPASQPETSAPATQEDAGDPRIPVPTPRPGAGGPVETAATDEPATDISVETSASVPPSAGTPEVFEDDVSCARYLGQPMNRCAARVVRSGPDAATVTVTWPDGGTRVLDFRDGKPAGSNGRGEFRFTREATLNMIRIGASERFEILDALPFGD